MQAAFINRTPYGCCQNFKTNSRHLRSSNSQLFVIRFPRFKTNIKSMSFSVAAPSLWNTLRDNVKSANLYCNDISLSPQNIPFSFRLSPARFHPYVDDLEFVNGFNFAK